MDYNCNRAVQCLQFMLLPSHQLPYLIDGDIKITQSNAVSFGGNGKIVLSTPLHIPHTHIHTHAHVHTYWHIHPHTSHCRSCATLPESTTYVSICHATCISIYVLD